MMTHEAGSPSVHIPWIVTQIGEKGWHLLDGMEVCPLALNPPFITYLIHFRTLTNDDSSIYDYAQLVLGFSSLSL